MSLIGINGSALPRDRLEVPPPDECAGHGWTRGVGCVLTGGMDRLAKVRAQMASQGIDLLWVRSTDPWLNEYVPTEDALRAWLTGFSGSMGEAVVGPKQAWLIVDGRYWGQAEDETDDQWTIVKAGGSQSLEAHVHDVLREAQGQRVGLGAARTTLCALRTLRDRLPDREVVALDPDLVERARGPALDPRTPAEFRTVSKERLGLSSKQRLERLWRELALEVEGWLVQPLDDIAYLTGIRAREMPHQATFRAWAIAWRDEIWVATPDGRGPEPDGVRVMSDEALLGALTDRAGSRIGHDPGRCTVAHRQRLDDAGCVLVPADDPLPELKTRKTPEELACMKEALARADRVLHGTILWVQTEIRSGRRVSEADVAQRIEDAFLEEGASNLSFRVIAGAGEHSAIIHYGTPDPERWLRPGELMLIDNGGHFHEGLATDMTRTFLVGDGVPSAEQRRRFTAVLRGAMAGMRARLPEGATAAQLDGIVRAPIWEAGGDYAHGTGHGVGINVHEFPPRLSAASSDVLCPGQVFSIEPGWYDPEVGGIRIENLCTLVPSPTHPGFNEVEPLTFCPLDERLVDPTALTDADRSWLARYRRRFEDA
ncbi:MAG: M24 family metallopeptidase [Myxococcota bacterium]